jgi:hypothetical protein
MRRPLRFFVIIVLAAMALPVRLPAAEDKVVEIEWTVMRQRLAGSEGRSFHFVLADGRSFRTTLLRIDDDGLVVGGDSRIPRSEVAALRQTGRRGWGRLIGTVAGAALMIAVIAHPGKRTDTVEGKRFTRGEAAALGSFFVPMGYLLGFCADKPHPELRPLP